MASLSASVPVMNIGDEAWGEQHEDWPGGGALSKRLVPGGGPMLGASLYALGPGNVGVYHAHHASEEHRHRPRRRARPAQRHG